MTSHVFAETTHVVVAPCGFACVVIPPHSYIFQVSSKSIQGLGSPWGSKFAHSYYFGYHAYANGKVNGIGEISHSSPPQPLDQLGCRFKYITMSAQGVNVPNLIKIDLAVAALRMREKKRYRVGFLLTSIYLLLLKNFAV